MTTEHTNSIFYGHMSLNFFAECKFHSKWHWFFQHLSRTVWVGAFVFISCIDNWKLQSFSHKKRSLHPWDVRFEQQFHVFPFPSSNWSQRTCFFRRSHFLSSYLLLILFETAVHMYGNKGHYKSILKLTSILGSYQW